MITAFTMLLHWAHFNVPIKDWKLFPLKILISAFKVEHFAINIKPRVQVNFKVYTSWKRLNNFCLWYLIINNIFLWFDFSDSVSSVQEMVFRSLYAHYYKYATRSTEMSNSCLGLNLLRIITHKARHYNVPNAAT